MNIAIVLILSFGAAMLVPATYFAFRARKMVRLRDGTRVPEQSDIIKILAPMISRSMDRRGGREKIADQLDWARIGFFTPETWLLANLLAGPICFLLAFAVFATIGSDGPMTVTMAGLAGAGGFLYPRVKMNSRLRKRQEAIKRDVIGFISLYSRTATGVGETTQVFAEMASIVARENAYRNLSSSSVVPLRPRRRSAYQSDLWIGLERMLRSKDVGIHRKNATAENPDPLMSFAVFCNDPEVDTFVDRVRQARNSERHISPEQLDIMVENLQQKRLSEVRRGFAKLVAKATMVLVGFGMPLLFTAVGAPIAYVLLTGF